MDDFDLKKPLASYSPPASPLSNDEEIPAEETDKTGNGSPSHTLDATSASKAKKEADLAKRMSAQVAAATSIGSPSQVSDELSVSYCTSRSM